MAYDCRFSKIAERISYERAVLKCKFDRKLQKFHVAIKLVFFLFLVVPIYALGKYTVIETANGTVQKCFYLKSG